ncbi:MAG: DUF6230 family protein [Parachlamydiaceae bacterium]|jgi:hypothetical protein
MNLAAESVIIGGQTVKKKLVFALLGGFVFLGSLLGLFGITGVAAAVPIVGDFTVSFDKMVGEGFQLYGSVSDSALQQKVPVAVNEIDKATITGLKISKDVPALGVRVVITTDKPVAITGLLQKATDIQGDATFEELTMSEKYIANQNLADPAVFAKALSEEFTQKAPKVTILNGKIKTLYLFQKTVSLNGMHVSFEKLN